MIYCFSRDPLFILTLVTMNTNSDCILSLGKALCLETQISIDLTPGRLERIRTRTEVIWCNRVGTAQIEFRRVSRGSDYYLTGCQRFHLKRVFSSIHQFIESDLSRSPQGAEVTKSDREMRGLSIINRREMYLDVSVFGIFLSCGGVASKVQLNLDIWRGRKISFSKLFRIGNRMTEFMYWWSKQYSIEHYPIVGVEN